MKNLIILFIFVSFAAQGQRREQLGVAKGYLPAGEYTTSTSSLTLNEETVFYHLQGEYQYARDWVYPSNIIWRDANGNIDPSPSPDPSGLSYRTDESSDQYWFIHLSRNREIININDVRYNAVSGSDFSRMERIMNALRSPEEATSYADSLYFPTQIDAKKWHRKALIGITRN